MKITKEKLKKIIMEELNEIRFGAGMSASNNPQSVDARERLGLQMDSYIEEAGAGKYDAKAVVRLQKIEPLRKELDAVKGELKGAKTKKHKSALLSKLLKIRSELKKIKADED